MSGRVGVWAVVIAFVIGLVVPVLAQQQPAAPAAKPAEPAKPAEAAKPAAKATETKAAAKTKSATGTIKSAAPDSITVVGKDNKEWIFVIDKETKITKGGKKADAKALAEKDQVTIRYAEVEGKMTAKSVAVTVAKAAAKKPSS